MLDNMRLFENVAAFGAALRRNFFLILVILGIAMILLGVALVYHGWYTPGLIIGFIGYPVAVLAIVGIWPSG